MLGATDRIKLLEIAAMGGAEGVDLIDIASMMENYVLHGNPKNQKHQPAKGSAGDISDLKGYQ